MARSAAATAALHRAAAAHRARLTPNDIAISRAADGARRIEAVLDGMRQCGKLREFNRQYKLRRAAAKATGKGFMSFAVATARLRLALISMLTGKQPTGPMQSLFAEIFRSS